MPRTIVRGSALVTMFIVATSLSAQTGKRPQSKATASDRRVATLLDPIVQRHKLPAMAAAVVTSRGLFASGVVGVRKAGTNISATLDDHWHMGSDTKAMTATLIGALVERGKLQWDTTIEQAFPNQTAAIDPALRKVSIVQLLSHRSGLTSNPAAGWHSIPRTLPIREQRITAIQRLGVDPLIAPPGSQGSYSNYGFVVAGAMTEQAANADWEDLIKQYVFQPLGMKSVGFGGVGTAGQVDQPWPHDQNGTPMPTNGPEMDNPPVIGPAGRVHCTMADWSRFIADQLRGARGQKALLKTATYKKLHTPPFGDQYALGWIAVERGWGGGTVYNHAGSNTMNFCVVWMAPAKDFAVLVATNQGGDAATKACDEAASALIAIAPTK